MRGGRSLIVAALACCGCAGSVFRYVDIAAPPEVAVDELRARASLTLERVNGTDTGFRGALRDGGTSLTVRAFATDAGTRLELETPGDRDSVWTTTPPTEVVKAVGVDPGWAYPFTWDVALGLSLAGAQARPLDWRIDAAFRLGGSFEVENSHEPRHTRWAVAPMAGVGGTFTGTAQAALRPMVTLSVTRQEVAEVVPGRVLPIEPRWQLDLSVAPLLFNLEGTSLEGEVCGGRSDFGLLCARAGSLVSGGRPTWSIGYRLGAWPSSLAGMTVLGAGLLLAAGFVAALGALHW